MKGNRFGHWTVMSYAFTSKSGHKHMNCICDCGTEKFVRLSKLTSGESKSCGCKRRELYDKGGSINGKRTKLYRVWLGIKDRCGNPKNVSFSRYGAIGINMCKEWEDFALFKKWAEDNGYKDGLSIDRIDNKKGYSKDNCRWADNFVQANNTKKNLFIEISGERFTIAQLARRFGIKYHKFYCAIKSKNGRERLLHLFPNCRQEDLIPVPMIENHIKERSTI